MRGGPVAAGVCLAVPVGSTAGRESRGGRLFRRWFARAGWAGVVGFRGVPCGGSAPVATSGGGVTVVVGPTPTVSVCVPVLLLKAC